MNFILIGESEDTKLTLSFEAVTLTDVMIEFENFLRGLGYHPKGSLEFVEEDDQESFDDEDEFEFVDEEQYDTEVSESLHSEFKL